jgi:hypothetical protein
MFAGFHFDRKFSASKLIFYLGGRCNLFIFHHSAMQSFLIFMFLFNLQSHSFSNIYVKRKYNITKSVIKIYSVYFNAVLLVFFFVISILFFFLEFLIYTFIRAKIAFSYILYIKLYTMLIASRILYIIIMFLLDSFFFNVIKYNITFKKVMYIFFC